MRDARLALITAVKSANGLNFGHSCPRKYVIMRRDFYQNGYKDMDHHGDYEGGWFYACINGNNTGWRWFCCEI